MKSNLIFLIFIGPSLLSLFQQSFQFTEQSRKVSFYNTIDQFVFVISNIKMAFFQYWIQFQE